MTQSQREAHEFHADVGVRRVARVYAEALLRAAEGKGQVDAILEEFSSLVDDLFKAEPRLETLLSSAALGRTARLDVLQKTFANRASEIFFHFLLVLSNHERLDLLRAILAEFRELYDKRAQRVRVQVLAAAPLADEQKQKLQQNLRDILHLEPVLYVREDPDLLGGLVIRVGDWQYDASVRTQLDILRNQLIASSSHEIQSGRDRFSLDSGN